MMDYSRWYKSGDALLAEIKNSRAGSGEADIWYMGQHGFILSLCGAIIYIDVILNDFLDKSGASRRCYPWPFESGASQRLDYYLCTHDHSDHLNLKTILPLAEANPQVRFIVPFPLRGKLTGAGIAEDRVLGAREGEELILKEGLTVSPLGAAHPEYISDEKGDLLYLGYIIRGGGISVYHSGDTYVTGRLVDSLRTAGPLDIAMLPINGGDWERTAANIIGNMSALDAAKLARAVPINLTIPTHYDLLPNNLENPALFADYMYRYSPGKRFHIFALGERFRYIKE
jgi:L-ascorbate metabolism protein UlaG (beta-lactamase superfamily)